jgi:triphosphoribosyl-dephospho-CoA synthase
MTIGQCATLACLIEATVPKPGNVHRGADFDDLTFGDFQAAAVAIGPMMERAATHGLVGAAVLEAVRATRQVAATNVNLGIVLLIAPLAAVPRNRPMMLGLRYVLSQLSQQDAADVYEAIRLAQPGGMSKVAEADVSGPPPDSLLHAMRLAADRDSIASQYVTDFADVFDLVVPELQRGLGQGWSLTDAVIRTHLRTMCELPDTLIARKCGLDKAREVAAWAGQVLEAGRPGDAAYHEALADLDFELRSDGHRLNPGTTADLIAAGLFVALRDRMIPLPIRF